MPSFERDFFLLQLNCCKCTFIKQRFAENLINSFAEVHWRFARSFLKSEMKFSMFHFNFQSFKNGTEFPNTPHSASPNVNILYKHSIIIRTRKLVTGTILLTEQDTFFEKLHQFPHKYSYHQQISI